MYCRTYEVDEIGAPVWAGDELGQLGLSFFAIHRNGPVFVGTPTYSLAMHASSRTVAKRPAMPVGSTPAGRTARPDRTWISKTAMTRYLRCPYAFWVIDSGRLPFEETLDEFRAELIRKGTAFQEKVEADAVPVAMTLGGWCSTGLPGPDERSGPVR